MSNPISTARFPKLITEPPVLNYQAAAENFNKLRTQLMEYAYKSDVAHIVVVKLRMMTMVPGRVKPILVEVRDFVHARHPD
jgi:hypothetical protein